MNVEKAKSVYIFLVAVATFFIFVFVILKAVSFHMEKPLPAQPVFVKVTIPEGYTVKDISEKFGNDKNFSNFNKENFLEIAKVKEGFLFPDTYLFYGTENEIEIIARMENTFKQKARDAATSTVILASVLEKEGKTPEDWKIISGILWKRMKVGMPLQVDAAPITYKQKGLPFAPIANPGLGAIEAAQNPVDSEYWYYLSDKNGLIHFSKTFDEHKIAKWKYLGY